MKVCVKSAAHSRRESLVALETDAKWARAGAAVCSKHEYLGWPLGQGFRSMRKDPQKDPLSSETASPLK